MWHNWLTIFTNNGNAKGTNMLRLKTFVSALALGAAIAPLAVHAETNLDKLGQMKTTGETEFTHVPQTGATADSVR